MVEVSIIIPCYGRSGATRECITSVNTLTEFKDYELICINDGSLDDTKDLLNTFITRKTIHKFINHEYNQGVAKSMNDGLAISEGDYLLKLDNDVKVIDPTWLSKLISTYKVFEDKVSLLGIIVEDWGIHTKIHTNNDCSIGLSHREINGACMFFSRKIYNQIGGFKEFSHPYGYEDLEYCTRSRRTRKLCGFIPDSQGMLQQMTEFDTEEYEQWKRDSSSGNSGEYYHRK